MKKGEKRINRMISWFLSFIMIASLMTSLGFMNQAEAEDGSTAIAVDGVKDDAWSLMTPLALSEEPGFSEAGGDLGNLYLHNDGHFLYFWVDATYPNWGSDGMYLDLAFNINGEDSGNGSSYWSSNFNFTGTDAKPQIHVLMRTNGDTGINWVSVDRATGSSSSENLLNSNNLNSALFAINREAGFEGRIPLALLGLQNEDQIRAIAVLSGNQNTHGAFDVSPREGNTIYTSWDQTSPDIQSTYSSPYVISGMEDSEDAIPAITSPVFNEDGTATVYAVSDKVQMYIVGSFAASRWQTPFVPMVSTGKSYVEYGTTKYIYEYTFTAGDFNNNNGRVEYKLCESDTPDASWSNVFRDPKNQNEICTNSVVYGLDIAGIDSNVLIGETLPLTGVRRLHDTSAIPLAGVNWSVSGSGSVTIDENGTLTIPSGTEPCAITITAAWQGITSTKTVNLVNEILQSPVINSDGTVTFNNNTHSGDTLYLVGSFNGWDNTGIAMTKNENGVFTKTLSLSPGHYEYKFFPVSGSWDNGFSDPLNPKMKDGNSVLVLPGIIPTMAGELKLDEHTGIGELALTAKLYDADETETDITPVWSLKEEAQGISIADSKLIADNPPESLQSVVVVAESGSFRTEKTIQIIRKTYTYKINYYRYSKDYTGWNLWLWTENADGKAYAFKGLSDGFMTGEYEFSSPKLSFIVRLNEWESKDVDYDRSIAIPDGEDSVEVWLIQGDPAVYYDKSRVDLSQKIQAAFMDSPSEIVLTTSHSIPDGALSTVALTDETAGTTLGTTVSRIGANKLEVTVAKPELIDVSHLLRISLAGFTENTVTFRNILNDGRYYYSGADLGFTYSPAATTFKVWAPTAKKVSTAIYADAGTYLADGTVSDHTGGVENAMTREDGGVWAVTVNGDLAGAYYMYKVEFADGTVNYAIDPYARAVSANGQRSVVVDLDRTDPVRWISEKPEMINPTDAVIYELHVRDFSIDPGSGIANKGKYKAFTETGTVTGKGNPTGIDHLKQLGVTHVHLLPVYDFKTVNELTVDDPASSNPKMNWGYDPQNYNVPEGSYSTDPTNPTKRITEFKEMVQALHDKGIRVVMDVVYNHTSSIEDGPFNKIVPGYFYRTDDTGKFTNGSGCGNEVATERPMVRKFIIDSVKYWADEYHVDGFRFDLAGLIDQDTMNQITSELQNEDPSMLIYGEPWTGGSTPLTNGVYKGSQKGNGYAVFNDDFRGAIKGDSDGTGTGFATGATGRESDIAAGLKGTLDSWAASPTETINYVAAHDNLNLWDKIVAASGKETLYGMLRGKIQDGAMKDGSSVEEAVQAAQPYLDVDTDDPLSNELVKRSILANGTVLLAQGIPFFHAGDEILRTKFGDQNSYKSPDAVNMIRWENKDLFTDVFDYYAGLIELRKTHPAFRMDTKEAIEAGFQITKANGSVVAFKLKNYANGDSWKNIFVVLNAAATGQTVSLPATGTWNVVVDHTAAGVTPLYTVSGSTVEVSPLSIMVLYDEENSESSVPTTLDLSNDPVALETGKSKTLTAYVKDQNGRIMTGQPILWEIADQSIASVSGGKITGLSKGTTELIVTSGSLNKTIPVHVVDAFIPIRLTITGATSVYATLSIQLTASVTDQFGQTMYNVPISWFSSDETVAAVNSSGNVTGINKGKATITAEVSAEVKATIEIQVNEYVDRYLILSYYRPDGDYTGWNLWIWGTGTEDKDMVLFDEIVNGAAIARIKVAPGCNNIGYIVRKGTDWNTAKQDIPDDRYIVLDPSAVITKARVTANQSDPFILKNVNGPVPANGSIYFYYRDDALFADGRMDEIESVNLLIGGNSYPMIYDADNECYEFVWTNVAEGVYEYSFEVALNGAATTVHDPKNTNEDGKSIVVYDVLDLEIQPSLSLSSVNYRQNTVLSLDIRDRETREKVVPREIYLDGTAIGMGSKVPISTELNAITLAVNDSVTAGIKQLPVTVVDEYGGTHQAIASLVVNTLSASAGFDWDEAVIYFLLTDRFNDGDPSNNDPYGFGDYNPELPGAYHGGDFKGITQKLDYLKKLGINTIWISPVVENIHYDVKDTNGGAFYGYHGYWALNFEKLNPHMGTLEDFHELIDEAHARGIKIMVDVVLNHAGYGLKASDAVNEGTIPNYPTSEDRARFAGLLREDPVFGDNILGEVSGLPDFKTEDPAVRAQLIAWQTAWITNLGVTAEGNTIDYFRIDTVNNVDETTWMDFRNAIAAVSPEFKVIGEAYNAGPTNGNSIPGNGRMDSLLDFSFKWWAKDFVNGQLERVENLLEQRNEMISNIATFGQFLSSHDEDGILSMLGGDKDKVKIAASLQITAKGQPVIYYGEELGLGGKADYPRYSNRDSLDWSQVEGNEMLAHYTKLLNIRKSYSDVFAKGDRQKVAGSDGEGYLVFSRSYKDDTLLVALNINTGAKTVKITVPYAENSKMLDVYNNRTYVVNSDKTVTLDIPSMADGGTAILSPAEETKTPGASGSSGSDQAIADQKALDAFNKLGGTITSTEAESFLNTLLLQDIIPETMGTILSGLIDKTDNITEGFLASVIRNMEKATTVIPSNYVHAEGRTTVKMSLNEIMTAAASIDKLYDQVAEKLKDSGKDLAGKVAGSRAMHISLTGSQFTDHFVLEIPSTGIDLLKEAGLDMFVSNRKTDLDIPVGTLESLAESGITVVIEVGTDAEGPLSFTDASRISDVLDYSLYVKDGQGNQTYAESLREALTVGFSLTDDQLAKVRNKRKLVVYYLNPDGTMEYMGGKLDGNTIWFETGHFSKYVVVESNATFSDIRGHWAKEYAEIFAARKITSGIGPDLFGPDVQITRGQFATFIAKALGIRYNAPCAARFADVKDGLYYTDAILALNRAGIIQGYGNGKFGPEDLLTREQMIVILMHAFNYVTGNNTIDTSNQASFSDIDEATSWAVESINAAKALGIISGGGHNMFAPKGAATRAQAAKVIIEMMIRAGEL